jgi:hypothetical protein
MTYKLSGKNIFTAFDLIQKIDTMRINSLINKYNNTNAIQLQSTINPVYIMIIHNSTKKSGYYQASFFKIINNDIIPMSDISRPDFKSLISEIYHNYNHYKIKEVII